MIDFVIAWVDGNDPNWLKERNKYTIDTTQDVNDARYRDWDILKYWFRAVEKYTPWVRKIHFITWGHLPEWLDTTNEKLHIVNHKDFIPKEYLPTFNSHTIELNLHRIEGLSEYFVYFNDDMFITALTDESYFFNDNLPCDEFILDAIYFAPDSAGSYNGNDLELINKNFNLKKKKKDYKLSQIYNPCYGMKNIYRTFTLMRWPWYTGFHYNHLPTSFLKSTFEEVWEKEYQTLHNTCLDKFRSKRNVNQWVFKYWQLASGNFYPRNPKYGKVYHLKTKPNAEIKDVICNKAYNMICINDTVKTKNFEEHKRLIKEGFEIALPHHSLFEKY